MASVSIRIIFIKDCLVYTEKTTQYLLKSPALVKFGVIYKHSETAETIEYVKN